MKARIAERHRRQFLTFGKKHRWGKHYLMRRYFRPRRAATVEALNPVVSWALLWFLAIAYILIPFLVGIMAFLMR